MPLAAAILMLAAVPSRIGVDQIALASHAIHVGDVANVQSADLRDRVIATVPAERDRISLSPAAVALLLRRAVPGLAVDARSAGMVTFVVRPDTLHRRAMACSATRTPVAARSAIGAEQIVPVPCRGVALAPIAFDRATSQPRATAALEPGHYLGRLYVPPSDGVREGEKVSLVSSVGVVRIVRGVTTLQASHGRRVFVRDADGQVFAVRRAELTR